MNKILTIDPSGTGTTGIFLKEGKKEEFCQFKSKEWEKHLHFLSNLIQEIKPDIIIYETTTYIYGRQHQGTVGLYKLIGGIVCLKNCFSFLSVINSIAVNQVKAFKNKLFANKEQIEGLTCEPGRGKGWKYQNKKINLHQLDALIIYHLWSDGSLESKENIAEKIKVLKAKKRLGIRQQEQLERLERIN